MTDLCYLCAKPATKPLKLKDSFTMHAACRVPTSNKMCDRCNDIINGDLQLAWYWNDTKNAWSKCYTRNFSWLFQGEQLIYPDIGEPEEHAAIDSDGNPKKPETLPVARSLLPRQQIRDILLNPPEPPFTLAIAESGQKHILPWAQEAQDRECFPVQFELDTIYLKRAEFSALLFAFEELLDLGFSKAEVNSGEYRSDRLTAALSPNFWHNEYAIARQRGTRLLELVSFLARSRLLDRSD